MDTPNTPETPETPEAPETPATLGAEASASAPPSAPRAGRPWGRYALVAGVSALALVGAATLGAIAVRGPAFEALRHERAGGDGTHGAGPSAGPMARGRADERVLVMPARITVERAVRAAHREEPRLGPARMDAAAREQQRTARLAELATELDLELDALTAAVDALHEELDAERDALREELADAPVDERRAAMQSLAEDRRARMRAVLIDLGADADAIDALLAEHAAEHGSMAPRGPRAGGLGGR